MERSFGLSAAEADIVHAALRYYASDVFDAFVEDGASPLLDDAVQAEDIAARLQTWLVASHQSLLRDVS